MLPVAALTLVVLHTARQLLRRPDSVSSTGVRLMAGALGVYGLAGAHDVIMYVRSMLGAPFPGYPVYLGFVDLAVMTALGLGTVVSLLDEERHRLHIAEGKLTRVFRSSPDAIAVTLPLEDGLIVDVNERFERIFGHRREEAVGKTTLELDLWVDPAEELAIWEESRAGMVRDR